MTKLLGLDDSSLLERCAVIGTFSGGVVGAIVGLIIGLTVHWQTAWFAIFEAGIPAGIVGGLLGVIAALVVTAARRTTGNDTPSESRRRSIASVCAASRDTPAWDEFRYSADFPRSLPLAPRTISLDF
jgi:hypothetical protein